MRALRRTPKGKNTALEGSGSKRRLTSARIGRRFSNYHPLWQHGERPDCRGRGPYRQADVGVTAVAEFDALTVTASVGPDGAAQVIVNGMGYHASGATANAGRENIVRFIATRVAAQHGHRIEADIDDPAGRWRLMIYPDGSVQVLSFTEASALAVAPGPVVDGRQGSAGTAAPEWVAGPVAQAAAPEPVANLVVEAAALEPVANLVVEAAAPEPVGNLVVEAAAPEPVEDPVVETAVPEPIVQDAEPVAHTPEPVAHTPEPVPHTPEPVEVVPEPAAIEPEPAPPAPSTIGAAWRPDPAHVAPLMDGPAWSAAQPLPQFAPSPPAPQLSAPPPAPQPPAPHVAAPHVAAPLWTPPAGVPERIVPPAATAIGSPATPPAPAPLQAGLPAPSPGSPGWAPPGPPAEVSAPRVAPPAAPIFTPGPPTEAPAAAVAASSLPTLSSLLAARPVETGGPATQGWQAAIRRLTGGLISPRPNPAEQQQRTNIAAVQRSLRGPRTVVVVNPKGGAHKTTATLLISATFGIHRGGYTLAWDNNETRGTLGWRANQARHTNTAVDLLRDLDRFDPSRGARVGDLDNYVRSQGSAQFDVLASDEDAASAASIDTEAFLSLHRTLSRFYRVIVVDTGNNMRAGNWQAAIDRADQLVIVSTVREDTAQSAAWLIDALRAAGRHEAVRNAVTVLAAPGRDLDGGLSDRLHSHFSQLTRAVLDVPHDEVLVPGGPLNIATLSPASRTAWLRVTATIAEGL